MKKQIRQTKEHVKIWSWAQKGGPTLRRTGRLTFGRKFNSTPLPREIYLMSNGQSFNMSGIRPPSGHRDQFFVRKILGFHGGDSEEGCLLGCYAAWLL
jgi:hypothetical protein